MNGLLSGLGGGPQIRAQFPPPDGAVGRFLNADGKPGPGRNAARKGAVQLGIGPKPKLPLKGSDVGDTGAKVHTIKLYLKRGHATRKFDIPEFGTGAEPVPMTKWPQHERLKAEILAYCSNHGTNYEGVAAALGWRCPRSEITPTGQSAPA